MRNFKRIIYTIRESGIGREYIVGMTMRRVLVLLLNACGNWNIRGRFLNLILQFWNPTSHSFTTFVWFLPFDLSGMGDPTRSKSSSQHSSQDHGNTQATPPRQGLVKGVEKCKDLSTPISLIKSACLTLLSCHSLRLSLSLSIYLSRSH